MCRAALAVLAVAACDPNRSGDLGATHLGDTSHPLAPASPLAELRAACGDGAPVGTEIHRRPYLQRFGPRSSTIGWISVAPDGERVVVTTPAGAPVTQASAYVQLAGTRGADEHQMWTDLAGLAPTTIHCYEVLAGAETRAPRTGFRTPPEATSPAPIRFLAFGDSGTGGADQLALRDQMLRYPYDFIVHTGDLAYDTGTIDQIEDNVFGVYHELFRNLPFYPASGNHDQVTLEGAPFRDVFALPFAPAATYYAYDWGQIHFAVLDTEADYAEQAAWLDADLAASTAPWKVLYMHRPPYSSGFHGSDLPLRDLIAPVAERHGVQLVLAGHDHNYERMVPQNGVAYLVTGGGGRGTYPSGEEGFTAFSESVIHFVVVEVGVDVMITHAIDATGVEFDSLVIPRVR